MIYDKIDAIKVTPQAGMARVGGINFPKQFHSSKLSPITTAPTESRTPRTI